MLQHVQNIEVDEDEMILMEMRKQVKDCLDTTCKEIKEILDSVKPSTYAKNIRTYEETIAVIKYLQAFGYSMNVAEKNRDNE